jgi:hypothetical protein
VTEAFGGLKIGDRLDPLALSISPDANERYWRSAGIDHPLLRAGALYPLIAANLTVLAFTRHCPDAMIQTRQQLHCHRRAVTPAELRTEAHVADRYDKRGLPYIVIGAHVTLDGEPLWDAHSHFTPAALVTAR